MTGPIRASWTPAPSAADSIPLQGSRLTRAQRWLSLAEFVLGSAIVIGHNVYHVIPNEVPILFVIGLISLRLRDGGWGVMGLPWPVSWRRTVLIALGVAAVRLVLGAVVIDPLTARFWPAAVAPSGMEEITGNVAVALRWLLIVWTFAAFGEEISYRGYLLTRAADVGARSKTAYRVAVLMVSVLLWTPAWPGWFLEPLTCCLDATYGSAFSLMGSLTRLEWLPSFLDGKLRWPHRQDLVGRPAGRPCYLLW